jgi:drug/metabolite transporter (DMT)-like permease
VGAHAFFGERLSARQWATLPVTVAGLLLLLGGGLTARNPAGVAFGLLASFFYSAYILASRRWLRGVPPLTSAFYVLLGAAVVLTALHVRSLPAGAGLWGVIAGTALVSTIAAVSLFLAGLQKLSGAEASMLSLAEPVTAVLLGVAVLHEALGLPQWAGALLVLACLAFLALADEVFP